MEDFGRTIFSVSTTKSPLGSFIQQRSMVAAKRGAGTTDDWSG